MKSERRGWPFVSRAADASPTGACEPASAGSRQLRNEPKYAARFTYAGMDTPSSSWLSASENALQFLPQHSSSSVRPPPY